MDAKYLLPLSPRLRRNVTAQVTTIKLAVNEAIPTGVDRACIILALSELIQDYTVLKIEQDPQGLEAR